MCSRRPSKCDTPQAAKNYRANQSALLGIFERLEYFFQRLEMYTPSALDQNMEDTVTKIMVEVLNIIGIATKEIKQGQISTSFLYEEVTVDRTIVRELYKEIVRP